jgi:hypothetical protein
VAKSNGAPPRTRPPAGPVPRGQIIAAETPAAAEERAIAEVQAAAEGVELTGKVEFFGQEFRLAAQVGLMPSLKFANAAESGIGSQDVAGMAAMYAMIRDVVYRGEPACGECDMCDPQPCGTCGPCTSGAGERNCLRAAETRTTVGNDPALCQYHDPGDWDRFEQHAIDVQADGDDLLEFVGQALAQIAARPTKRRSGSSSPGSGRSPKSKGTSPVEALIPPGSRKPPGFDGLQPVGDLLR